MSSSIISTTQAADNFAAYLAQNETTLLKIEGLDDWGPVVQDKDELIEVPFIVTKWKFHDGNFGQYVSALILTDTDQKLVLNDGSTGIYAQLKAVTDETGKSENLLAPKGLRRSDYEMNGRAARTYYLAG